MDLARIPDIGPVHAGILREAGITTVAELAALTDVEGLAARTKVHPATLEALQAAARAHVESLLEAAGVHGMEELARADLDVLAEGTGIPRSSLETFQRAARAKVTPLPDRVLLAEGRATARVSLQGEVRSGLAIVTLRMEEDEEAVLARVGGDAVLLKERAATAPVRIGGVVHRALPIYKEIPVTDAAPQETRVRVAAIKDRKLPVGTPVPVAGGEPAPAEPAKKGFRLFRRGK